MYVFFCLLRVLASFVCPHSHCSLFTYPVSDDMAAAASFDDEDYFWENDPSSLVNSRIAIENDTELTQSPEGLVTEWDPKVKNWISSSQLPQSLGLFTHDASISNLRMVCTWSGSATAVSIGTTSK